MATTLQIDGVLALKVDRVAQLLDCSESKIYDLIREDKLQVIKLSNGKKAGLRVLVSSLEAFLNGGVCKDPELTSAERVAAVSPRYRRSSKEWF